MAFQFVSLHLLHRYRRHRLILRSFCRDEIRNEIKALKKEYKSDRKGKEEPAKVENKQEKEHENEMVQDYISEQRKYSNIKKDMPKKGDAREQYTLQLLKKFKAKLDTIKTSKENDDNVEQQNDDDDVNDEELNSDKWLSHTLRFESKGAILAKDASTKKDDWHDIYDPRNPLNKRKRGDDKQSRDRDRDNRHGSSSSHRNRR